MDRIRKIVLFACLYFLIFWIGFKSGESYFRMKRKVEDQQSKLAIAVPAPAPAKIRKFYIMERRFYNGYSQVSFDRVTEDHEIIVFFLNRKLRPLLKLRKIRIYTSSGDRIY